MFKEKRFVRYLDNQSNILLDAPHAKPPRREWLTDYIVETIAVNEDFNCINMELYTVTV